MASSDFAPPVSPKWQFFIDRGGTFTDVVAKAPDGTLRTAKLLSHHPELYRDAAVAGIQQLLGAEISSGQLTAELSRQIAAVKIGTTVATNALLERRGEPTALVITRGFGDQLKIGYQNRPKLFESNIRLPEPLYSAVIEAQERISTSGEVLVPLDVAALTESLSALFVRGMRAVAIVFLHAWRYPQHELRAAEAARAVGFSQISVSHQVSPLIKLVPRGDTTVADAYLSPVIRGYVDQLSEELYPSTERFPLYFMKSSGELTSAATFQGKDAILSGPAGGIVAMVETALRAGYSQVVGLDMGGTSADVSHFSGSSVADCERQFDSSLAGVRLRVPTMAIHTIAAGGGSVLHFDGERYRVGPDSAGATPGPACYRRGGPLTITDCNVLLGRLRPEFFPALFGPNGDQALDAAVVRERFTELTDRIAKRTQSAITPEAVALGFLRVAVTNMANAIKVVSVQRGHDLRSYTLVSFGGAGGQHACAIADELGLTRILIHPLAGVLSALGMGLSHVGNLRRATLELPLATESLPLLNETIAGLTRDILAELNAQGITEAETTTRTDVYLKVAGTDSTLAVPVGDVPSMRSAFEALYRTRFRISEALTSVTIDSVAVEILDTRPTVDLQLPARHATPAAATRLVSIFADGKQVATPVFERTLLCPGQLIQGPAIVTEADTTTVVEPGWCASVTTRLDLVLERTVPLSATSDAVHESHPVEAAHDPALLEVFNGLLMSIAEQMGVQLANTAQSINIKERLDFSCAIFDQYGNLVANAPHVPVHLGSMGETVHAVIAQNPDLKRGDVFIVNDPYHGGTHLPDITAVMPVFSDADAEVAGFAADVPWFYVAARGHHADVGGIAPGSMPPNSRSVDEEGVLIDNFKLVDAGTFREAELVQLLTAGIYPARNPAQNVADLRAQVVACETGARELKRAVERYGYPTVRSYLQHIQDNAEESVRRVLATQTGGTFACQLDCGATVCVSISVDQQARSAVIDFGGTSPQLENNYNAPPAVVHAAVLYVFRTLVADDIPLNAGCFKPLTVIIPEASMLSPKPPAATVAGNVETSQCVVDALYGALGGLAASQGTMNNLTFGTERYQYYETIAGGSGAGPGFDGSPAVQTHMTNSRITDPEVLELRYPVFVEEHSIRHGSGGKGAYRGGDGALRRIRAREPMSAAILAGRRTTAPYGVSGGSAGEAGATWVERVDGTREILSYSQQVTLNTGDVIAVSTPSGGGFGSTTTRRS